MNKHVKVAAAQISPEYMRCDATIDKIVDAIGEAARHGAELVVFPETLIPGYPSWRGIRPMSVWNEWMLRYQENSLEIGTPAFEKICQAAKRAQVWCSLGCSERDQTQGRYSLYNSIVYISSEGRLAGRHRKLMPTHAERTVWGAGDARDLIAVDAPFARIGGLICYEHLMPPVKAAMIEVGEEIHCASWSGFWVNAPHQGSKRRWRAGDPTEQEPSFTSRSYAVETQTFVIQVGNYIDSENLPIEAREWDIQAGGSAIYGPGGTILAGPVFDKEEILYAVCDDDLRRASKAYIDTAGHYRRDDVVSVRILKPT